jgi:ureidoacrylate peracid hydrolase
MVHFTIDPRRTALIVVDMQNCFVENSPFAAPCGRGILDRLNDLAEVCRASGGLVVHTAQVVRRDGSNLGVLGETLPPVKAGLINEDTGSAALHPDLQVGAGDVVIRKPLFGAFTATDLELILRRHSIDTVVVGGIATNVCCDTTAREAMQRDFQVVFLSDGTTTFGLPGSALGSATAEEIQRVTCATLGFGFAEVATVSDMAARFSSGFERAPAAKPANQGSSPPHLARPTGTEPIN